MAQKAGVCSTLVQMIFWLGRPRNDFCVGNVPSDQPFGRLLASCQARPKGSVFCADTFGDDNFVVGDDDDDVVFFFRKMHSGLNYYVKCEKEQSSRGFPRT